MSGDGDAAKTVAALEERVAQLEFVVGVIASQIAEPPTKRRPANEPGGTRIVRKPTSSEIRSEVAGLLDGLGLDGIDFKVL